MDVGEELGDGRAGFRGAKSERVFGDKVQQVDEDGVVAAPGVKQGFEQGLSFHRSLRYDVG